MAQIIPTSATNLPAWVRLAANALNNLITSNPVLKSYTVATLPSGEAGMLIYVTDETGGEIPAFCDSAGAWRRVTDRAVVS